MFVSVFLFWGLGLTALRCMMASVTTSTKKNLLDANRIVSSVPGGTSCRPHPLEF